MENDKMFQEKIEREMILEQRILNALFRVVEMGGEEAKQRAELLTSIILSNRMDVLTEHTDIMFVDNLTASLQKELLESLRAPVPHDKDTHEELIHAYISLSKALEYQRFMAQLKG